VAHAQLAWLLREKMLLQEGNVLEKQLLLQILGARGDDHPLAAANDGQKVSESLPRAGSGLDDEMPAFLQSSFYSFSHLQLAAAKLMLRVRLAEKACRRKELVRRRHLEG